MTTEEQYINRVLENMPRATPRRTQIALELRGHIAERLAHGHTIDEALRQLGDPMTLAESYLSAVPLISAPFLRRAAAKIIDVLSLLAVLVPILWLAFQFAGDEFGFPLVIIGGVLGGTVLFGIYVVVAEALAGRTLGKRLLGLRVVRESGARISIGQSIVRQLPIFLQVYWIDAMFALFTEKSQRAFELLSKTRVVADQEAS
jgi:uncharacterized RDD family membrane protein YckC